MAPTSLSRRAIGLLRNELGFLGVVISDDMEMKAITDSYSVEEAAVAAIRAGNNILMYSNYTSRHPDLPVTLIAALKKRALEDLELRQLIEQSYAKIVALKGRLPAAKNRDSLDLTRRSTP